MTPCIFYLRLHLCGKNNVYSGQTLDRYGDFCLEPINVALRHSENIFASALNTTSNSTRPGTARGPHCWGGVHLQNLPSRFFFSNLPSGNRTEGAKMLFFIKIVGFRAVNWMISTKKVGL